MTSLSQALSIALSGLQTNVGLISVASNNISNAQTAGYTAKTATVAAVQYGADFGGSSVTGYSRVTDAALTTNYNESTTSASYYSTLSGYMSSVQTLLDSTDSNPTLTNDIAQFSAAWSSYSSNPESTVQQQSVIAAGSTLASDLSSLASKVTALDTTVQSNTATTVDAFNSDLTKLAQINQQIGAAAGAGEPIVNLQDQQDALITDISKYTAVSVQTRASGQVALYSTTGQLLVDGSVPIKFSYNGSAITDTNGTDVTNTLTGGSIQAELQFRDQSASAASSTTAGVGVIAKLKAQLSTLAGALSSASGLFGTAYSAAATASLAGTQSGDNVASSFFTISNDSNGNPDPATLRVNTQLTTGGYALPETDTTSIANSFTQTANYTTSGLNAINATYSTLGSAILSSFQQSANTLSTQSTSATSQQTYYQQALSNATGVSLDTELANLVTYQNSYAASAHVISTVNEMLTSLMQVLG